MSESVGNVSEQSENRTNYLSENILLFLQSRKNISSKCTPDGFRRNVGAVGMIGTVFLSMIKESIYQYPMSRLLPIAKIFENCTKLIFSQTDGLTCYLQVGTNRLGAHHFQPITNKI